MDDEGLADVEAANPFRLPRFHPGMVTGTLSFRLCGSARRLPGSPHKTAGPPVKRGSARDFRQKSGFRSYGLCARARVFSAYEPRHGKPTAR